MDVEKFTTTELQVMRSEIERELMRRMSVPFGAGRLIAPAVYGCCGKMPCERTACSLPKVA